MPRLSNAAWEIAKEKYVTVPGVTYEQLRLELGVTRKTVERHGKEGDWPALRREHLRKMSVETDKAIAETDKRINEISEEMSVERTKEQSKQVDKGLRLVETYQAGLAGIIYQCLLRLGMVKTARTEDEAELVKRSPELWNAMDAKDLNRVLQKSIDGQLDLMKQKALMTGKPTERVEMIERHEILVIERTAEEQQEFERVIGRIRETAEEAGLALPEG